MSGRCLSRDRIKRTAPDRFPSIWGRSYSDAANALAERRECEADLKAGMFLHRAGSGAFVASDQAIKVQGLIGEPPSFLPEG
jgi:hypothetical protein